MKAIGAQKFVTFALSIFLVTGLAACGGQSVPPPAAKTEPAPQTGQAAKEAWEVDFEKTVEAAKQEGEVAIIGPAATSREQLMAEFEKAYPGIKVKYVGMRPSMAVPKILAEQQQGKYLTDILIEGGQQIAFDLYPAGATDDVRKFIVFPDIKDDSHWHLGYEAGYSMANNTGQFVFAVLALPNVHINNDVIPEGEITSFQDLLDPKWKGKMVLQDFSKQAQGHGLLSALAATEGKDFVLKLLEQKPLILDDPRQIVEAYATGKYPIGLGLDNAKLRQFKDQGVIKKSGKLQPPKSEMLSTFPIGVFKNQPHPNATKVFINWFLSKEGQSKFVELTRETQSRRNDVPPSPSPDVRGWDKIDYKTSNLEKGGLEAAKWVTELSKTYFTK